MPVIRRLILSLLTAACLAAWQSEKTRNLDYEFRLHFLTDQRNLAAAREHLLELSADFAKTKENAVSLEKELASLHQQATKSCDGKFDPVAVTCQ
jgi:hypothetical protein